MANTAIENLTELTSPDTGGADVLAIVDLTVPTTKKITSRNLLKATITRDIYIDASRFISVTTNGAAINELELATNDIMLNTADFDTTTSEKIQFWHKFEENWNAGTITFSLDWTNAAGLAAETIDFDLAARAYANDDPIDAAHASPQNVTDTWIAQNDMHTTSFSSAITIQGTPADAEPINFQLSRDVAADDMTGDVKIIGITIRYTVTDLASS